MHLVDDRWYAGPMMPATTPDMLARWKWWRAHPTRPTAIYALNLARLSLGRPYVSLELAAGHNQMEPLGAQLEPAGVGLAMMYTRACGTVACPRCQAKPGEECTYRIGGMRFPLGRPHAARARAMARP